MDWKKDYKVSDLFKRSEGKEAPAAKPVDAAKADESVWKKEIKFSTLFRRKRTSPPKEQLALPAPGDTLSEAPTAAAPVPPAAPEPEVVVTAPESVAPPADVEAAPIADAVPAADSAAETSDAPVTQEPESDAAGLAAAAAVAGAAAAAAASEPPAPAPAPDQVAPAAPEAELPSTETAPPAAAEAAAGKKKRFGRNRESGDGSGPERREHQPGPTAGHASSRKPTKAGQLPQVPLMKALNLLPQDIKLPKTTLRPKVAQFAVAGVAVLVAVGMGFFWWSENQRLDDRRATLEDRKAELAALQGEIEVPSGQDGTALAGEALSRATALSGAIDTRVGWDRMLRELSLTLPDNVWFSGMTTATSMGVPQVTTDESGAPVPTIPTGPSSLTITGFAMTEDDVAQLLSRLGVIPEFSSVQLQVAAEETELTPSYFEFTVVANLKPLPGGTS
jgi:Tfp pilus assembly protein PilN